jgi:type I site-specific restriction endonuclease
MTRQVVNYTQLHRPQPDPRRDRPASFRVELFDVVFIDERHRSIW